MFREGDYDIFCVGLFNALFDPATDNTSRERFRYGGTRDIQLCIGEAFKILWWFITDLFGINIDWVKAPFIDCTSLAPDIICKPDTSYIYDGQGLIPSRPGDLCIAPRFTMKEWTDVRDSMLKLPGHFKYSLYVYEAPYNAIKKNISELSLKACEIYEYSKRDATKPTPGNQAWSKEQLLSGITPVLNGIMEIATLMNASKKSHRGLLSPVTP